MRRVPTNSFYTSQRSLLRSAFSFKGREENVSAFEKAFADYIAGVSVGPTTGRSERRSLAIVQAGYESAQTGKPINLRERFGDI